MSLILQDSSGQNWSVGVTNGGLITTSKVSNVTAQLPVLVDSSRNFWNLQITTIGLLQTSPTVLHTSTAVNNIGLISPNQSTYALQVLPTGIIQTLLATSVPPPFFYNVKDSNNGVWGIGVLTDGTPYTIKLSSNTSLSPVVNIEDNQNFGVWRLSAGTDGSIESISTTGPASPPLLLLDTSGKVWQVGILDSTGDIITTRSNVLVISQTPIPFLCVAPRPFDTTSSQFGPLPIFHLPTGNLVTVLADYSLYCCALQRFVLPEDTNVIEILDE